MLLSVLWFGKKLTSGQWLGVGLVFGGVGAEGWIQHEDKKKKLDQKDEEWLKPTIDLYTKFCD